MTTLNLILWIYIVLLVAGGLIGFFKAGSKVSLFMAAGFALLLTVCALGLVKTPWLPEVLLAALLAVFAVRLKKTGKFMPSGLMLALTAGALLLRWLLR